MAISFSEKYANDFLCENDILGLAPQIKAAHEQLNAKNGLGNDFLGWLDLPINYDKAEFARIKKAALPPGGHFPRCRRRRIYRP